ncbi:hypothetical protein [Pedobacter panaciterrae]
MSKRALWLICFCFGYSLSYGETKQDSIKLYYSNKNKAELAIIDSNYSEALVFYKKAFSYKQPNARELYNSFVVAYLLKDTINTQNFYNALALHGLEKEKFELSKNFGRTIVKDDFYIYISRNYDSLYQRSAKTQMPKWGRILDSLYKVDQRVRSTKSDNIASVDSLNRTFLSKHISKHGFPGFNQVGFYDKMLGGQAYSPTTFWFVMWHARYQYVALDNVAFQGVMSGDFPPEDYALLMDTKEDPVYYSILKKEVVDGKIKFLTPLDEKYIDEKRAVIFLDKLSDFKKKLNYMQNGDRRFQFLPVMLVSLNFAQ